MHQVSLKNQIILPFDVVDSKNEEILSRTINGIERMRLGNTWGA